MKHYRVMVLERAKREYAVANTWWRINRLAAPNMLRDEFRAAKELLARIPEAGHIDQSKNTEIRCLLLPGVRYAVFYRVEHAAQEIHIAAFWHLSRETTRL